MVEKLIIYLALLLNISNRIQIECALRNPIFNLNKREDFKPNELSESIQHVLTSLPHDRIPDEFKSPRDDNSHWCCKNQPPMTTIDQTRIVSYNIVASGTHRCGYHSCGFLGWSSCTAWCTTYWNEVRYSTEVYSITKEQPCPPENIVCCSNYFLILGHCFHISEIQNNLELLAELNSQGVVLPPGVILVGKK